MDCPGFYHHSIPVFLQACMETPLMARLRQVGMNCGCEYTSFPRFRDLPPYCRFEHSVGTALIVWHFTGDPAQAAAGLLHDAATPVFSHVVDFLRGDALRQEATEAGTEELIRRSRELRAVLERYGIPVEDVCDYHRYPIADNPSPRLSADRLEYSLSNALQFGFRTLPELEGYYLDLTVVPNEEGKPELAFRHREAAEGFAEAALACSRVYVSDEDRYAMQRLAELLGDALRSGVLAEADLASTEPAVIASLRRHPATAAAWEAFRRMERLLRAREPGPAGPWRRIAAKKRAIDPLVAGEGRLRTLSPAFAAHLEGFLSEGQEAWLCVEEPGHNSTPRQD